MYQYTIAQWGLFFFLYAFIGWIWECFYVAVKEAYESKRWKFVNRGFLHGPVIPIYGFAAIAILITTISFRENSYAIFGIGALTATGFELITGTLMERLFKVKYWDYSKMPLNYHGHICFFVSMFWGFFSVLLVRIIHVPLEKLVVQIPKIPCGILMVICFIFFFQDTISSFNEAMDLRDILESISNNNETIRNIERRIDAIYAFTLIPDMEDLREVKQDVRNRIYLRIETLRQINENRINKIKEYINLPEFNDELERVDILEKLEFHRKQMIEKTNKQFIRALKVLKRNSGAKSEKYQEVLDMIEEWLKD